MIVSIPTKAVEKLADLNKQMENDETWDVAFRHGYVEALRDLMPDRVGLILMEADCLASGEPGLPRLEVVPAGKGGRP